MSNEWNEVKTPWVKFTEIGDNIFGTLISVRDMQSTLPGKEGQMVKVYEIKADGGSYHDTDDKGNTIEQAIEIKPGEILNMGGGYIDTRFRNIKLGSKVKIEFTSEIAPKTKGFNPTKVKTVMTNGKVDSSWLEAQEEEKAGGGFEAI